MKYNFSNNLNKEVYWWVWAKTVEARECVCDFMQSIRRKVSTLLDGQLYVGEKWKKGGRVNLSPNLKF